MPFEEPGRIASLMRDFDKPWYIAGGWAIDLFLGRETRSHQDIEIAILRDDQLSLQSHFKGWDFEKVIPLDDGHRMEPWHDGEYLELPVHEIQGKKVDGEGQSLELLLNQVEGDTWKFRRNQEVTRPLSDIGMMSSDCIPFLGPEVVLLYKSKDSREHDETDFANIAEILDDKRRAWLCWALAKCYSYKGHEWLDTLLPPETVNHLEMTEYDSLNPSSKAIDDAEIKKQEIPNPKLSKYLYENVGKEWYWIDKSHWGNEEWRKFVNQPGFETWTLHVGGSLAGYFELKPEPEGSVEIVYFGLLPDFVGQGLGGYLLAEALEQAWRLSGSRVWLHTSSRDHPHALANYQARGLRIFKTEVLKT